MVSFSKMKLLKYCCSNSLVKLMHSLSYNIADEPRLRGFFLSVPLLALSLALRDPRCSKELTLKNSKPKMSSLRETGT